MHGTETTPNDTFCHSLSLHDALPISVFVPAVPARRIGGEPAKNTRSRRGREVPSEAIIDYANCRHWITGQILVPHVMDRHVRMRLPICHHARSEEHTSELQSLMRISYAVFCLKKKKNQPQQNRQITTSMI